MLGPDDAHVVRMEHRSREQRSAGEGQERPGQGEDIGAPRRAPGRWPGGRVRRSEARIGDWSTHDVARRWRIGASRRIRWTHTADQADVITLASTAIIAPVAPAKAVAAGTTQNPLFGLTAQASRAPVAGAATAPRRLGAEEHHPEPGGQTERAQELADRRQPPDRHQREGGRRGQDLNPQHHRPRALDGRAALRRWPSPGSLQRRSRSG